MSKRVAYVSERPVTGPSQDAFQFTAYADALALLINDHDTQTPLTVAISGPSGSGKTTLGKLLVTRLKVEEYWLLSWNKGPIICWFNALIHSDAPNLSSALFARVTRVVSSHRPLFWRLISPLPSNMISPAQRLWRRLWIGLAIGILVLFAVLTFLALLPQYRHNSALGGLFGNSKYLALAAVIPAAIALFQKGYGIKDSVGMFIDAPRSAAAQGTIEEASEQLGKIMRQALYGRRHRIVIFIDDLDRCPAKSALDLCDILGQVFNQVNVVTVIVANVDLLDAAAEARYGQTEYASLAKAGHDMAQEFLNRLIQVRFDIPPIGDIRRSKILSNEMRLYEQIALAQNVLGGKPELTNEHLSKWLIILVYWPRLAAALRRDWTKIRALEDSADIDELQRRLDAIVPGVTATDDLVGILHGGVPLSPVLSRLIRLEAQKVDQNPVDSGNGINAP